MDMHAAEGTAFFFPLLQKQQHQRRGIRTAGKTGKHGRGHFRHAGFQPIQQTHVTASVSAAPRILSTEAGS